MYSSILRSISALDGVGGQRHVPAALPQRKTGCPLCRRLGWPRSRSGWVRKISPPLEFDPRTLQSVDSRYTDYDIPAHTLCVTVITISVLESIVRFTEKQIMEQQQYSLTLERIFF
jgi:hypothetical protein